MLLKRQKKQGPERNVAIYCRCRNQRNRKTAKYDEHREKATYLCNVERNKILQTAKNENYNKQNNKNKKNTIMKTTKLFIAAVACFFMQSVSIFAGDMIIPTNQLPAAAKTFVKTNFPGQTISYAKLDREFSGTRYEVRLNNGVELDFDKNGTWDKVDCNYSAVPAKLVPASIANYVKANFAGASIVKIDKERYGYDIELSNDLELKFNKNGKLMSIDD